MSKEALCPRDLTWPNRKSNPGSVRKLIAFFQSLQILACWTPVTQMIPKVCAPSKKMTKRHAIGPYTKNVIFAIRPTLAIHTLRAPSCTTDCWARSALNNLSTIAVNCPEATFSDNCYLWGVYMLNSFVTCQKGDRDLFLTTGHWEKNNRNHLRVWTTQSKSVARKAR